MATESFSYIIHCIFEIEYLGNGKCYRGDTCCGKMLCPAKVFCESSMVYGSSTGSYANASKIFQDAVESLFVVRFRWDKRRLKEECVTFQKCVIENDVAITVL